MTDSSEDDLHKYFNYFNKKGKDSSIGKETNVICYHNEICSEAHNASFESGILCSKYSEEMSAANHLSTFEKTVCATKYESDADLKQLKMKNNSDKMISVSTDESNGDKSDGDEDMDYILILDNVSDKEIESQILNGNHSEKEIYVFNENETSDNQPNDDFAVPSNTVRLKSGSLDAGTIIHSCSHCDYTTSKRYLLSRHLRAHSDDRPYRCSVCERGFKSNASLLNHVNTHLGNKPHHCKNCEMTFTTSGELVRHVRYKHTMEKPHKCTECDYASVELSKLKRHMRCHTGERPFQCPHCTYASPDTFKLKRHIRTHTGEKPYECDICHARFTQSNSMKAHRMIHSVGEKPVFQCSLCPTTCGRKTDLRIHIQKLHHSDEPINCKRCGKSFPDRYSYKVHIKTHEGEKCFRCNVCPYASISLRHLESHMLIHTDQKPFTCEICTLAFRQKQLLKRHINLYHNKLYIPPKPLEKRHICPHCQRSFSHKGNLMRHMELHDPDSNLKQQKLKLQLGRKTRVTDECSNEVLDCENDMIIQKLYEEDADYYERTEEFEIVETVDNDEMGQKAVIRQKLKKETDFPKNWVDEPRSDIRTLSIKKEVDGKEFVAVEDMNGQQYVVVEVIHCSNEEEDTEEESLISENLNPNISVINSNKEDNNVTTWDNENVEGNDDNSDNKETIHLRAIDDD